MHNQSVLLMNNARDKAHNLRLASPPHANRRWWVAVVVALAVFTSRAADPSASLRKRILAGELITFAAGQPEAERTIPAGWLAEAARSGAAVNLSNALITESLDLRHAAVTNRFRLNQCVLKATANCPFAVFEQGFDFTDSQFAADADFTGALAKRAALLRGTTFSGAAVFTDATAEDVFLVHGAAFLGKESKFNRVSFLKTVGFGPRPRSTGGILQRQCHL